MKINICTLHEQWWVSDPVSSLKAHHFYGFARKSNCLGHTKTNWAFSLSREVSSFLFMHYIIIETHWQWEICPSGIGDLIWYTYFLLKLDSQSSLKIKYRMVCRWLSRVCGLWISSPIFPSVKDSVKDQIEIHP